MNNNAVGADALLRHAAQLFMSEMHWIAGLKCHHLVPVAPFDFRTNFNGCFEGIRKFILEITEVQNLDIARDAVHTKNG